MVQFNFTTLKEKKQVALTFTDKPVSAWGGLVLFSKYEQEIGLVEELKSTLPFELTSPNATKPEDTMLSFIAGVLVGSRRFQHLELLRQDKVVKKILDINRYPTDATFARFFRRFGQKQVEEMFPKLFRWQFNRVATREAGYTLDLDSSVFERYGKQEGAKKGYNPKKRGRPSHHPILAVLSEANMVVHGWLRSGNTKSSRGANAFLLETLSILPQHIKVSAIRGDSGFSDGNFLDFLESESISKQYAIGMKFTGRLQAKTTLITSWQKIAKGIEIGEVYYQATTWRKARRVIIIREHVPAILSWTVRYRK
ncbi:MAG: transposase [Elusimicrobiota bacterium]